MSNEKNQMSDRAANIWAWVTIIMVIMGTVWVILGVINTPFTIRGLQDREAKFLAAQLEISLSVSEKASFVDATASYAKENQKPLNEWIERLAAEKRWGLLPPLPKGYESDWVEIVKDKPILLPKS